MRSKFNKNYTKSIVAQHIEILIYQISSRSTNKNENVDPLALCQGIHTYCFISC
jgi:hypothetical protein